METIVWVLIFLMQPGTVAATSIVVDNIVSKEECNTLGKGIFQTFIINGDSSSAKFTCAPVKKIVTK